MLGTRVADDVVWGAACRHHVDVPRLLAEVGLDGLDERDTGSLSGGELQRLAVAAALARKPSLLIADEVTSMVDQQGRDGLMSVLGGLTRTRDMSLVHITHYNEEAEAADRVVNLAGGSEMVQAAEAPTASDEACSEVPVLELTRCRPPLRRRNPLGQERAGAISTWWYTRVTACRSTASTAPASRRWPGSWPG